MLRCVGALGCGNYVALVAAAAAPSTPPMLAALLRLALPQVRQRALCVMARAYLSLHSGDAVHLLGLAGADGTAQEQDAALCLCLKAAAERPGASPSLAQAANVLEAARGEAVMISFRAAKA